MREHIRKFANMEIALAFIDEIKDYRGDYYEIFNVGVNVYCKVNICRTDDLNYDNEDIKYHLEQFISFARWFEKGYYAKTLIL